MRAVNGGPFRSTVANTATFLEVSGVPRPGSFSLEKNPSRDQRQGRSAAIILAMSVLLKALS